MKSWDVSADPSGAEGRYRLLLEAIKDHAIYMLDRDGTITSWNAGATRLKGYEADEVLGTNYSRFHLAEAQQDDQPAKNLAIALNEGRFEGEGWRVRRDGTRFWAHVVIDPIFSPEGEHLGFAKITRDLTERREAQLALEQAREALFQAQKMEAVGQLTGGVAHDFNNLLMAIQASLDLVRKRLPHDPKITSLIDNAMQAAQRGTSLTQRMLAFARRQELNRENVDVASLVRGMTELMQRTLGQGVSVETSFPISLPQVTTDPNQLESAVLNLAINARDAMARGGVITISGRLEALGRDNALSLEPGRYVCIAVTDQGEGMDEKTLRRAVEPFFTTKGIGKGTGLGLPMVHGLAEQSGGRLVLRSKRDQGTTAEIWLPVAEGEPADVGDHLQTPPKAAPQHKLNILAVDDDALVLFNTVAMLEELGHNAFDAASGRAALGVLESHPIDLLVTDQAMPGMTGLELAQVVQERWPRTQIIVATGYAELPEGSPHFPKLNKPFLEAELAAAVTTAIAGMAEADESIGAGGRNRTDTP